MLLPGWVQSRTTHGRWRQTLLMFAGATFILFTLYKVPMFPEMAVQDYPVSPWAVSPGLFPPLLKLRRDAIQESEDALVAPFDVFPAPLKPRGSRQRVPKVVHYVFGLKPVKKGEEPDELPYYAYLAMRSALINIKPEKVYFYYQNLPIGPWWDLIAPHLTLVKLPETVDEVYGNPVSKFAHKADIVRLWAIQKSGGIYLDIDMFIAKPFDDLLYAPMTMGMEASPDSRRSPFDPTGLCNAVIIAEPQATFIDHWMRTYVTFDEKNWAGHSVDMPWDLARIYPDDIQVLNTTAFFWPLWSADFIEKLHSTDEYNFARTGQYAYHAWESLAMKWLHNLSPSSIRNVNTGFHRLVRPFIGPKDDEVFAKWKPKHNL